MTTIYCGVLRRRWKSARARAGISGLGHNRINQRLVRERKEQDEQLEAVWTQALLYVGFFLITWTWVVLYYGLHGSKEFARTAMLWIHFFCFPLQGFLNLIAFARPTYIRIRKGNPGQGRWWAVRETLRKEIAVGREPSVREKDLTSKPLDVSQFNSVTVLGDQSVGVSRPFDTSEQLTKSKDFSTVSGTVQGSHTFHTLAETGGSNMHSIESLPATNDTDDDEYPRHTSVNFSLSNDSPNAE